jgi:hypothetical protein
MPLYNIRAPALPIQPSEYDHRQLDQFQNALRLYFNRLDDYNSQASVVPSGTTADRPTLSLQIGQYYFDTTIGRPIWWNGTNWINAAGTVV